MPSVSVAVPPAGVVTLPLVTRVPVGVEAMLRTERASPFPSVSLPRTSTVVAATCAVTESSTAVGTAFTTSTCTSPVPRWPAASSTV